MISVLLSSNGDFELGSQVLSDFDYVIAVDGGIRHLEKLGIKPHLWVGDMDSSKDLMVDKNFIEGVKIEQLPEKKDMSDTDYAVEKAFEYGARKITLIGGIGTRFDHSIFNVNLFFKLTGEGINCCILDGRQELRFLCAGEFNHSENKDISVDVLDKKGMTMSIVPFSDLKALTLEDVEYPLLDKDVSRYSNLTLSNIIKSNHAKIKLESGMVLIIFSEGY